MLSKVSTVRSNRSSCPQRGRSFGDQLVFGLAITSVVSSALLFLGFYKRRSLWRFLRLRCSWLFSSYLAKTNVARVEMLAMCRSEFKCGALPHIGGNNPTHNHPKSAAWRSSATVFARSFGARVGLLPYVCQGSNTDVRDALRYSRSFHWAKDVSVPPQPLQHYSQCLPIYVDVDYYLDMPGVLLNSSGPVYLYTFAPNKVCECAGEYSFRFNGLDEVTYRVAGGASYQHCVWNYNGDVLSVCGWIGWPVPKYVVKSYLVERRAANPHHEHVLLIPIGEWVGLAAFFALGLEHVWLERLRVNYGDFNVLDVQTSSGLSRSIARVGDYNSAEIERKTLDALLAFDATSAVRIGLPTVQSWVENNKHMAAVVLDYIKSKLHRGISFPVTVYPVSEGVRGYQMITKYADIVESDSLMKSFMSPVLPGAFVPTKAISNEIACVAHRVVAPQVESAKMCIGRDKVFAKYMDEYIDLIVPIKHKGIPETAEYVRERMNRPSQRALLDRAEASTAKSVGVMFLKQEAYQYANVPRGISEFDPVTMREYARYFYPVQENVLEVLSCYSFSMCPVDIASNVARIATRAKAGAVCADLSKMDGHVSERTRVLELALLQAYFAPEYHSEVSDLHDKQYRLKMRTRLGTKYKTDFQRGSGSHETAGFNTNVVIFCAYVTFRELGYAKLEAWSMTQELLQAAGDDSVLAVVGDPKTFMLELVRSFELVGQLCECEYFPVGSSGLNYLSRFYTSDVWCGDPGSTCDLPRILSKLHTTVNLVEFTPVQKLAQKLEGLRRTDRNSPIVRNIVDAAERVGLFSHVGLLHRQVVSWWAHWDQGANWPNPIVADESELIVRMCGDVNVAPLYSYLADCKVVEDLLRMPTIQAVELIPPKNKIDCVVDGSVSLAIGKVDDAHLKTEKVVSVAMKEVREVPVCINYLMRKCKSGGCKFRHIKVCKDFVSGKCSRKKCTFEHVALDSRAKAALLGQ